MTRAGIESFLNHLAVERNASPHTVSNYARDLARYEQWLDAHGLDVHTVTTADVVAFVGDMGQGLAPSSVARNLAAVRSLHKFLCAEGVVAGDVAAVVSPPAAPKNLPHALSRQQVATLLEVAQTAASELGEDTSTAAAREHAVAVRTWALVEVLYGTGMRISEAVGLDVGSIDRQQRLVRVVGKGRKERIIPVGAPAVAAVDAWLVRGREVLARGKTPALFVNARGGRLSRQSAWNGLHALAARAGISGAFGPHSLRHSYATHLLEGGADIRSVQELLGHASVTTTQIYTAVTIEGLREVYAHSHPRA